MHHCGYCFGILASDRWMNANLRQTVLRNLRKGVFDGKPAGYRCPTCQGEMVKGPVPTNKGATIEVDGCLKCGSLWFDNREIEPFFPEIQDLELIPESGASKTTKSAISVIDAILNPSPILDAISFFRRKKDDSEE